MATREEFQVAETTVDSLEDLEVIEAADLEQAGAFHAFRFKVRM